MDKDPLNYRFSLAELEEMPVLSQGHFENIMYEDDDCRIVLSRMTKADGAPYDNQVTVIRKDIHGNTRVAFRYQAK